MSTSMLALMFGVYILATGAGMALRPAKMENVFSDLHDHPALTYLTGAFVFFLGALILSVHRSWDSPLEGIVTFAAWATTIKGLLFLVWPGLILGLGKKMLPSNATSRVYGILMALLGLSVTGYVLAG